MSIRRSTLFEWGMAMKSKALPVAAIFLLNQGIVDRITVCKDESSMALMEIARNVNVPSMIVTRSFDGAKATVCDSFEPMNDFQVVPSKICWDGRTGEPFEGIKNIFLLNEKMMLQSKTPVEPPEAIKQDYQNYGVRCGYTI